MFNLDSEKFDCFSWLYNEHLNTCTEKCAVRFKCKAETRNRLQEMGDKKFSESKKVLISELEKLDTPSSDEDLDFNPATSELVLKIIEIFKEKDCKPVFRQGCISIKFKKRCIFEITKKKSKRLDKLIKFVYSKTRDEFPPDLLNQYVSKEKHGKYYYMTINNTEDLKQVIDSYLKYITE